MPKSKTVGKENWKIKERKGCARGTKKAWENIPTDWCILGVKPHSTCQILLFQFYYATIYIAFEVSAGKSA